MMTLATVPTFNEGSPDTMTYYWQLSNGESWLGGTVGLYFTPSAQHVGRYIRLVAEVEKEGYESWSYVFEFPTAVVTAADAAVTGPVPTITGTPKLGQTLKANPGTWGPAGVTLAYQWFAAGKAIKGATGSTLKLTAAHVGTAITVKVTGSRAGLTPLTRESRATAKVAPLDFPTSSITAWPTKVAGKVKVGRTVSVTAPKVRVDGAVVQYQWYAGGLAIKNATKRSLKLTKALKGKSVVVKVSVVKPGYRTVSKVVTAGKVRK
jgi:hypothetical protein